MSENRKIQPISFEIDTWELVKKEAEKDSRNWSQMANVLIKEALAARKK